MILSAAPFFEDVLLHRCLGSLAGFAYAELDPGDPAMDSVSQWFDLSGWRGVIVAPADREIVWRAARPNAEIISVDRDETRIDQDETWQAAKPFGFIRFAKLGRDAASIIATAQPLIVLTVTDDDIEGYRCLQAAGMAGRAPRYFVRADRAAEFAPLLSWHLARDEFKMTERQAAALARMLAVSEAVSARTRVDFDRAHQQWAQEIARRDCRIEALDRDNQARDREIESLSLNIQAVNQAIMARDRDIAALHQTIAIRDRELGELRPRAETLARLASMLDWPEAPRALRAVLPLARALRRFSPR